MNFNHQFNILFWLNKAKTNSQGLIPIWVRITVDGKRAECSTQKLIDPKRWDVVNGRAFDKSFAEKNLNDFLSMMKGEIIRHYNILVSTGTLVSAETVKNSFKGINERKKTFLELFTQYNAQMLEKKEIGELSQRRYSRFTMLAERWRKFFVHKYKRSDTALEDQKLNIIVEFEHYLKIVEKIAHNTANKYVKDTRQVLKYGVMLEYLPSNPFEHFRCTYRKTSRQFLEQEELDLLYKKENLPKRLEEVRDCFLFSCYTGYAYVDAASLTPDDVTTGIDGEKWIIFSRVKTNVRENVPLLPIPLEIIAKYRSHEYCKKTNKLLPLNSNQKYNDYLKELAKECGIKKNLTTHSARHTFATTVLLTNDVPIETVMELLGHADIRTTQIYGRIVQKKVSTDMGYLRRKLLDTAKSTATANHKK